MAGRVGESKSWLSFLPLPGQGLKAVYTQGSDQRLNLFDKDVGDFRKHASSIACLVESKYLKEKGQGYELNGVKKLKEQFSEKKPLDPATPFKDEYAPAFATAFYVGPKLALTAGHCLCARGTRNLLDLSQIRLVFGFYMTDETTHTPLLRRTVCEIKKIIDRSFNQEADYALLELDKVPKDAISLSLDFVNVIQDSIQIGMLGHSLGLPQKFVIGKIIAKEREVAAKTSKFPAEIDGFAGNSGSPIFNLSTGQVVGIFLSGNDDYDRTGSTVKLRHYASEEAEREGYESCQRLSALPKTVIGLINSAAEKDLEETTKKCQDAIGHINQGEKKEAIEMLQSLADNGVYAAHCALAALVEDSTQKEVHKQEALGSGLFTSTSIEAVIQSVVSMMESPQPALAQAEVGVVNVDDEAIYDEYVGPGGRKSTGTINARGRGIVISRVGGPPPQHSASQDAAAARKQIRGPAEKKK